MLLLAVGPAVAQTEDPTPWTLPRLIQHALSNNKGLEAARLATNVAREDVIIAGGQRLPRLDAVSNFLYFPIRERLLIERHGFRPTPLNSGDNPFQQTIVNYGLLATLPLYTGGRIRHEMSIAEAAVAASRSRAEMSRQELIFNVTSGFYTYLLVSAVIEANEAAVRSVGEAKRIAAAQAAIGRAAPLDVIRLDARLSAVESQLAVTRNDLQRSAATLKALLALPPAQKLTVAGKLKPVAASWDVERAHAAALEKRPGLIALRQELEAQKQRIGIASARRGPAVDASVFYGAATGEDKTSDDARFMLRFRLPLFTGDILPAKQRREAARLKALEAILADAERSVSTEVERALIELSSAEVRIEASFRSITQAEEALRVEGQKFREGRGTSNDLLLAEEALLRAKTEYAAALGDNLIAAASLKFSTGELDVPRE